jgi:excinuclease UvrABC ATPase subunit
MLKSVFFVIIFSSLLFSQESTKPEHGYVGAELCGMCHRTEKQGNQFGIWKKSLHSQAFKTLQTAEADKIAKEKGFETPAAKTPECLKCHVTAYNVDPSMLGKKFNMEDGVQCEACHGPGADYKSLKVMKDKKEAIAKGLIIPEDIHTFCVKCHNSESPTFNKDMNLDKMWEKIKHPIPAK